MRASIVLINTTVECLRLYHIVPMSMRRTSVKLTNNGAQSWPQKPSSKVIQNFQCSSK